MVRCCGEGAVHPHTRTPAFCRAAKSPRHQQPPGDGTRNANDGRIDGRAMTIENRIEWFLGLDDGCRPS